ncbi:MAG: TonB-dependent receptor [Candidatus Kapabacteria bacterium]|nr:TonB-dependent receptor [Candidatus Kapabacteria bacterium]
MLRLYILTFLTLTSSVIAADSVRVDTTKRTPITVIADRWLTDATGAGMPTTSIDRTLLSRLAPQSLVTVLPLIPGVFVRDYGGLGGLKTFSIRGGSASQALVMIDETRLSSAQNGTVDIGMLPARFVDNIDVIRGGVSALYGANALTGAMDIRMRVPASNTLRAFASGGSFDEWRLGLGASASVGTVRIGADVESLGTKGSFPFTTDQFGETYSINRENGDAKSTFGTLRVEADEIGSFTFLGRTTDRGVPGAVLQGNITNARARLKDDDLMGLLKARVLSSSTSTVSLVGSARMLDQHYSDPDATITGPSGIDVRYHQRDASLGLVSKGTLQGLLYTSRLDASYADLRGDAIVTDSGSLVLRRSIGISSDWQWEGALGSPLDLRAALRVDGFSDMGWAVSPLLALKYTISEQLSFRASWSYNFRPPTFNELYFLNYGTRSLKPERSQSYNAGVVVRPWSWLVIDADAFAIFTKDLIVSVPVSPVITSAQNVGSARSMGMELLARGSWLDGRLIAQWSYTLQKVSDNTGRAGIDRTMIPYAVPELASILLQWDDAVWTGSLQWNYTGYRYAQPGEEFTSLLQPFALVSAQVGVHVSGRTTRADVRLQADNVFDVSYMVVRGYPMPGRVFRLSTSLVINP